MVDLSIAMLNYQKVLRLRLQWLQWTIIDYCGLSHILIINYNKYPLELRFLKKDYSDYTGVLTSDLMIVVSDVDGCGVRSGGALHSLSWCPVVNVAI